MVGTTASRDRGDMTGTESNVHVVESLAWTGLASAVSALQSGCLAMTEESWEDFIDYSGIQSMQ